MRWPGDLDGWPNAEASRRVLCRPHRWHVQDLGSGPEVLLLHGAGSSSHSWAGVMARMAGNYRCIAIDLPGHGFTQLGSRFRSSLDRMAEDIASLLSYESIAPRVIIGHSAGSAVALRLALNANPPPLVVGINPAIERFDGLAGWLFPIMAKALAVNPLTSWVFSAGTNAEARAERLIRGTGSLLPPDKMGCYARLISDRAHVEGTLLMMSQWSLDRLNFDLPHFASPCLFLTGTDDKAVPPAVSARGAARMEDTRHLNLDNLGHLAHEEDPDKMAEIIMGWMSEML